MKNFYTLWLGQTLSGFGTQISSFALGIWIYNTTGSAIMFGISVALQTLPGIFLSPIAGVYVDRINRRMVMLICDFLDAVILVVLLYLLLNEQMGVFHIYAVVFLSAILATFQGLAYSTAVPQIVPEEKLGNINGLVQLSLHGVAVFVPVIAATMMLSIDIKGIIILDLATFFVAVVTLIIVKIPDPKNRDKEAQEPTFKDNIEEIKDAWRYLKGKQGLLPLLYFFSIATFAIGFVQVLFRPLALDMFDLTILGYLMTAGGIGGLIGALLMSIWGGPHAYIKGVTGFMLLAGFSIILCAVAREPILMGIGAFAFSFSVPLITSCSQTIWQKSIPNEIQGKVFSFRQVISTCFMPLGLILSPFLAENVFKPIMAQDNSFTQTMLLVLGDTPSRGMAILFLFMGLFVVVTSLTAMRLRDIRSLTAVTRTSEQSA